MSAADSPGVREGTATALADAEFVRLLATADGDALAATGLLARALSAIEIPFQTTLAAVPGTSTTDADCTVAVGHAGGDITLRSEPLSRDAHGIVEELTPDATDPTLALAGVVCSGAAPTDAELEGLERRLGVALPTDTPTDLAYSTLVHAGFSGEEGVHAGFSGEEDVEIDDSDTASGDDEDARRRLASYVALSAVVDAPPRAAEAVEVALHPYACDRFETLGGYADVLDAVARLQPGTGVALALGSDVEAQAIETWREHGRRTHTALRSAETSRYDGVFVASVDTQTPIPIGSVAEVLSSYRSPEPITVVVTDGAAAVVAERSIETPLGEAVRAVDGRVAVRGGRGEARFDDAAEFLVAFREAL